MPTYIIETECNVKIRTHVKAENEDKAKEYALNRRVVAGEVSRAAVEENWVYVVGKVTVVTDMKILGEK